ncbi:MAG: hypothetical protein A2086_02385 [Spirochaetes bacterium GWD1_27_9]|nr:MAG: hypothetical protein A2Z98_08250 [Spirochaetes bacterium GWB1_27_13]OHD27761.1 MAG: hypothetical protein A2Y34_08980 [Spirochaetes bacterium GWC1_27_15]OHD31578.1 MAG: hypothetical protein A2086_02385 [Spirochaetes bacterium GWD1_27_9]
MNNIKYFFKTKHFFILLCVLVTLLIRLPFLVPNIDFNNDAPTYSENMKKPFFGGNYDVQPPGYVSFIYLGRFLHIFIENPVIIQHIINMFLVALISFAFFELLMLFGFLFYEASLFTIIFSLNDVLLLGSITGGNRLFLTLCTILTIYLSIKIIIHDKKNLILLFGLIIAFFMGFRQDISFMFIPLYIFLFFVIKDFKLIILSLLIFGVVCVTWFIPLVLEYGGFYSYIMVIKNQKAVYDSSLIFSGVSLSPILNISRVFVYMFNSLLFVLPFFIYSIYKKQFYIPKNILIILIFCFIPAFLFQLFVHNGNFVHLAAILTQLFIFLIFNFRINSKPKIIYSIIIMFFLLFQFFGVKMFQNPNFTQKIVNVLWLQYTYDGVKSGETLRLRQLENEFKEKTE